MSVYDYVVVGGGSAGCVVAGELASDPAVRVLLLEMGPAAEDHPETLLADGYKDAFANDAVLRERFTVPQPEAGRQRVFSGTGSVLGGSGAVNAMVYTRGAKEDFAEWPEGWRWDDVQDDFRAVEAALRPNRRAPTRWTEACIEAAVAEGFRRRPDLNDGDMANAIGYEWMNYEGEQRRNSYVAFVKEPARPNLTVVPKARVHRVTFQGRRADGVRYETGGELLTARARREVVLAAGALETPKLLMLSGVGPGEHLHHFHIPVVADRAEVGQGLHDHPNVPVFYKGAAEVDCGYPQVYSFYRTNVGSDLPKGQSDTCYVFWPAPSALQQMVKRVGPTKLPAGLYGPNSKRVIRGAVDLAFRVGALRRFTSQMFGIIVILGKPKSRGALRLASSNAAEQAEIDPGYYTHPEDLETMVMGVKKARRLAQAQPLAPFAPKELMPGRRVESDAAIERFVRTNTITTYHFAGSCRMGSDDAAVVDTELRVRGVEGLRVADASVIAWTPVSALNAPSMLIGYRAARLLRASQL
ncbi:MAG: GMC family oxidoreductase N-terminal domain-containing protein [Myxococcales bacterium]|nr:GMC family oxidoreductase N-terminal domain-containing protein [Myxococcales bacterium]MCB9647918.1 GMC family oxidoreductase N-terminal domain-containing protein [Deltaproteobacteria bacterium]